MNLIPDIASNLTTILVTLLTVAGSAGAWKFYEEKLKHATKEKEEIAKEQTLFRDDLRDRITVLEARLEEREREKEALQNQLTQLIAQLAEYKVRLEFLERENASLQSELKRKFMN